jgi:dCMP deaminase
MRPTLERTLMDTARVWASRSTCPDLHVGCVVATPDGHVQATGYNGSPRGMAHCEKISVHLRLEGSLTTGPITVCKDNYYQQTHKVVHAERNAINEAARRGKALDGCVAYVTHAPCWKCAADLVQAGIARVVFAAGSLEPWMLEMPAEFVPAGESGPP